MKSKGFDQLLSIIAVIMIVIGMRYVTQAGQGLGVIQNDGYGATGGIILIIAGAILGYLFTRRNSYEKRPKRSELKNNSEQNLAELKEYADSVKNKKNEK